MGSESILGLGPWDQAPSLILKKGKLACLPLPQTDACLIRTPASSCRKGARMPGGHQIEAGMSILPPGDQILASCHHVRSNAPPAPPPCPPYSHCRWGHNCITVVCYSSNGHTEHSRDCMMCTFMSGRLRCTSNDWYGLCWDDGGSSTVRAELQQFSSASADSAAVVAEDTGWERNWWSKHAVARMLLVVLGLQISRAEVSWVSSVRQQPYILCRLDYLIPQ